MVFCKLPVVETIHFLLLKRRKIENFCVIAKFKPRVKMAIGLHHLKKPCQIYIDTKGFVKIRTDRRPMPFFVYIFAFGS